MNTPRKRTTKQPAVVWALSAGAVMAAGVLALWFVIDQRAHEHAGSSTEHTVHMNQLLIRQDSQNRRMALDRLANRSLQGNDATRIEWEADAERYLVDMPGFVAIQWIDDSGVLRGQVVGDAAPLIANLNQGEVQDGLLEPSYSAAKEAFSSVTTDASGTPWITVVVPVVHHETYEGVIAGLLNPAEWMESVIGALQGADHHVEVLLEGRRVFHHAVHGDEADEHLRITQTFSAGDLEWTLHVTPTTSFLSTGHADSSSLVLIVGLMMSALTTLAVYFGIAARNRSHQYHDIALQLRTLFRNLPGMAYRRNNGDDGQMAFVSEGCHALSGFSRELFISGEKDWIDLVHADDRARVISSIESAFGDGEPFEVSYRISNADGKTRWMWERGRVIPSEVDHDDHLEGFVTDITEQRSAECEAREHREHLAHVDRLNLLGEMATGIAHEINQPLTAISLFVQAGGRMVDEGKHEKLPEIFDKLNRHAHRASAVIERMQDMARRRESARTVVGCELLVGDIVRLAESEAHIRDMTIEVDTEDNLPDVAVDAVQIQQVALNLLRNGMESMQSIGCVNGTGIGLEVSRLSDGSIEFAVIDCGAGVAQDAIESIFAPFSTTKKSGMGMGLSISRAIVTAHGGRLDCRDNSMGGATFFFTLPPANPEGVT